MTATPDILGALAQATGHQAAQKAAAAETIFPAHPTAATVSAAIKAGSSVRRSGRAGSGTGNLRNFKAMGDAKLLALHDTLALEDNDPDAAQAVSALVQGRGLDSAGATVPYDQFDEHGGYLPV
jgi:hypothetical protein